MQGQKTNGQKTQTSHQPLIISVNNGCHPYRLQTTVSGTLTHFSSTKYTLFETVSLTQLICFNQPFASAIAFTTTNIFMCMNTADTSGQNACTPWTYIYNVVLLLTATQWWLSYRDILCMRTLMMCLHAAGTSSAEPSGRRFGQQQQAN